MMPNAFSIYWTAKGWGGYVQGDPILGAGGSAYVGRIVPGDRVYVTNIADGVLRLLGAFTVSAVTKASEGRPPGVLWEAKEYLWPAVGTATGFAIRELPYETTSSLRFMDGADRVAMDRKAPKSVERNAMRQVRKLVPASAQVLEQAIDTAKLPFISAGDQRSQDHLSADLLKLVTPDLVFEGVAALIDGAPHGFGDSTDYDLIADDGTRLPPEAVFGLALSRALNRQISPKHFSGGEGSPCFRLLREAGYQVIPKGASPSSIVDLGWGPGVADSNVYPEGAKLLVQHVSRERKPGAVRAKKADFVKKHGRLFCERCSKDPVEEYGSDHGDACIEVHHARVQVASMTKDHLTRLDDLQCLCANCHRFVHRLLRLGLPDLVPVVRTLKTSQ